VSGYVLGGYVLTIAALLIYGFAVARRSWAARRRQHAPRAPQMAPLLADVTRDAAWTEPGEKAP
jgi:hypothetical protein